MVDFSASRSNGDRARRGPGSSRRRTDGRCPRTAFMRGFSNMYHTTGKRFPSSPSFHTRLSPKNPRTKAVRGHEARCWSCEGATRRSLPRRGTPLQRPREVAGVPRYGAASGLAAFRATGPTLWPRRRTASLPESLRRRAAGRPRPPRFCIAALPASYFSQYSVPSFVRPMKP